MDISALILMLAAKSPWALAALAILGGLVVFGQAVVAATPSKSDDAAWEKLKAIPFVGQALSILANFAPIQKR